MDELTFEVDGITYEHPRKHNWVANYEYDRIQNNLSYLPMHYLLRPMVTLKEDVPTDPYIINQIQYRPKRVNGEWCEDGWLIHGNVHGKDDCEWFGCDA